MSNGNPEHYFLARGGEIGELIRDKDWSQLLYNLISNSLRFSKNGEKPHLKIHSEIVQGEKLSSQHPSKEMRYCHVSISDNGIGFDPQYRERMFEVFQRLHNKNQFDGTGIGLAIVKKIVENHKGHITADGRINKGATFDIYLPAD